MRVEDGRVDKLTKGIDAIEEWISEVFREWDDTMPERRPPLGAMMEADKAVIAATKARMLYEGHLYARALENDPEEKNDEEASP